MEENSINISTPTLYTFRRCPYAIRARLALRYASISVKQIEVSLKDKPKKMIQLSPKATVPVLQLADDDVIDESRDIMLWALSKNDPQNWYYGLDKKYRGKIDNLIRHHDENFKPLLDRYKYANHYPNYSQEEYRKEAERFIKQLQRLLDRHRFLMGNDITLADIAIFPFIRQFAFVDKDWFDNSEYKSVGQWLDGFLATDLYQQVMEKR